MSHLQRRAVAPRLAPSLISLCNLVNVRVNSMNDARNNPELAAQPRIPEPWKQRQGSRGAWIAVTFIVAALVVTVAIIQGAYHRSSRNVPVLPEPRKVATT